MWIITHIYIYTWMIDQREVALENWRVQYVSDWVRASPGDLSCIYFCRDIFIFKSTYLTLPPLRFHRDFHSAGCRQNLVRINSLFFFLFNGWTPQSGGLIDRRMREWDNTGGQIKHPGTPTLGMECRGGGRGDLRLTKLNSKVGSNPVVVHHMRSFL